MVTGGLLGMYQKIQILGDFQIWVSYSFFINLVLVFSSLTYPNIDTKLYRQTDLFI